MYDHSRTNTQHCTSCLLHHYAGMSGVLQRYSVGIRCICISMYSTKFQLLILEFLPALTVHSTHWTHIQCWYRFSVGNSCLSKVTQLWFSRRWNFVYIKSLEVNAFSDGHSIHSESLKGKPQGDFRFYVSTCSRASTHSSYHLQMQMHEGTWLLYEHLHRLLRPLSCASAEETLWEPNEGTATAECYTCTLCLGLGNILSIYVQGFFSQAWNLVCRRCRLLQKSFENIVFLKVDKDLV